jgi:formate dehydrogenase major subunit
VIGAVQRRRACTSRGQALDEFRSIHDRSALDSYNTGVQSGGYRSPLRRRESLDLSPEDCERLGVDDGELVKVTSRRGSVYAPVRIDQTLRPGLAFMTLHFPDEVETNVLTIDATDPKSGTAEFKASAIRVDRLTDAERTGQAASQLAVPAK